MPARAFDPNLPLGSVENAKGKIVAAIVDKWNVDVGAKGIETFRVTLRVFISPDGTVQRAVVVDRQGSPPDALRAFADGAVRAALRAEKLPIDPVLATQVAAGYLELNFSAADMVQRR